jgi:hypothetical protein
MRTQADVWTTSVDVRTKRTSGWTFSSKNVCYDIPDLQEVWNIEKKIIFHKGIRSSHTKADF